MCINHSLASFGELTYSCLNDLDVYPPVYNVSILKFKVQDLLRHIPLV